MSVIKVPAHLLVSPQPVPKIGKSDRTRAEVMNAALDFIWSNPFRSLTVQSLMASTHVTRSAFYQHFNNLHELMENLLVISQKEVFSACAPWLTGVGDPVALTWESLDGLVRVCYDRGPIFRAVADAATTDQRFEGVWSKFLGGFDDAATARIEADQAQSLIPDFDARPVAIALNRLDAYTIIEAFGQRPRKKPKPIREALVRIWISTLYGDQWVSKGSSTLIRT